MHRTRSSLLAAALAGLVGLGTVPAVSLAQAQGLPAPREVTVRLSPTGVRAPDSLAAGRYLLNVQAPPHVPGFVQLVKPDRGYTLADLRADSRRPGPGGEQRILQSLRFFGGAEVRAGRSGALFETLYAGRYWLVGFAARPGGLSIKVVHVHGAPTMSSFPEVSAEATGTDKGLRLTRTAPRAGRMLIRNIRNMSMDFDALTLLPLKKGVTYADFLRWVRKPNGDVPVRFRAARSTSLLSPDAGYVLRYRLHPGDYVVISLSSLMAPSGPRPLHRLFRPLTVVGGAGAGSARAAAAAGTEGFQKAPEVARSIERWMTAGSGTGSAPRLAGEIRGSLAR